jgi:hypothetical protein
MQSDIIVKTSFENAVELSSYSENSVCDEIDIKLHSENGCNFWVQNLVFAIILS